ncbi:E3 ubiquitin-protein ligase MPSR1-like [Lycium ferocissimum]|uniref:E3 ubiquitin-protein ligase MPSR1-like n=1 Tax=Lycium ferocissimum TaxID=112874 RepID=UPI002816092D|nr:E3 ubiquitin-protein ligase MPSR1-like [Lycium ferocissimum]
MEVVRPYIDRIFEYDTNSSFQRFRVGLRRTRIVERRVFRRTEGPVLPATKASIEALPVVEIDEAIDLTECAICLLEFQPGGQAKEMPCQHRYHSNCINKWLRIHGSCPVCRYVMPLDHKRGDGVN